MAAAALANPGTDSAVTAAARKGTHDLLGFLDVLNDLGPATSGYPNTTLGTQLQLAARILAEDVGVRVIHIPVYGDFDTHRDHVARCAKNMTMIDDALSKFLSDLDARGLADSTLVMQYSEFGRRGYSNNSAGLDHGAANMFFMAGAVTPGVYGTYPSFGSPDTNGNLPPTVTMNEYYAIAAESGSAWRSGLLTGSPTPVPGIIA